MSTLLNLSKEQANQARAILRLLAGRWRGGEWGRKEFSGIVFMKNPNCSLLKAKHRYLLMMLVYMSLAD